MSRAQGHDVADDDSEDMLPGDYTAGSKQPPKEHAEPPPLPPPNTNPETDKSKQPTTTTKSKEDYDKGIAEAMRAFRSGKPMPTSAVVHADEPEGDVPVAAPGHPAPGDSASNGMAERAVQPLEGQVLAMKLALEDRIGTAIPSNHPTMHWMVSHAACLPSVCLEWEDATTGYEKWHGQKARMQLPELGKTILYFVPANNRFDLEANLGLLIFLCKSYTSDPNVIGLKTVPSLAPVV